MLKWKTFLGAPLASRRRPVRQYDQADCGPAALLSVLRYWGGNDSLVHVRELSGTDSRGTTMLTLVRAAEALGLSARGAMGEYEDLMREQMPCIAHVVFDERLLHYVVVYEIDETGVLVGDPAKGRYRLSRDEFLRVWTERAVILLEPTERLRNDAPPHWIRWILAHFHKEEAWLYQSVFLGVVYTLLGLITAFFVQWLIDHFIPERSYSKIIALGVALLVLQLLRAAAGYLRQRFTVELSRRVNLRVNEDFLRHLFRLPSRFFESRKTGDITARLNDSIRIQSALLLVFGGTVIDALVIVGSLSFLFVLAPALAWIALAALPVYAVLLFLLTHRIAAEQRGAMKGYAQVEASYIDSLSGMDEIRGYNAGGAFTALNRFLYEQFQKAVASLGMTQARAAFNAEMTGGALTIGCLVYGAVLVIQEQLLLGQLMAAYSLLMSLIPATNGLVEAHISLQGASVAAQRLMDLLLTQPEANPGTNPFRLSEKLEVRGGEFTWPRGDRLLKGVDLSIRRGSLTGLWGLSGAGKSTLVKILERKYDLTGGAVLLDGVPAEEFDLPEYRRHVGVVPETPKIFNGTIAENILMGRSFDSQEELLARIESTGLNPFLSRFEAGLNTLVGEEGRQLSSGERQVIGLIRALLDEPSVLLMDEGVSAIDVLTTSLIFAVVEQYARSHAVLLISHDLRSLQSADVIHLLEDGRITESGTPEALLKKAGRFRQLWKIREPLLTTSE
jgi:ABC-type bacteriocin/lantibiotic exporter with double-glycine peptidase domain